MQGIALWDSYMAGYDFLTRVRSYQSQLQDIADAFEEVRGRRILDAGSGTGNLSIFLKSKGAEMVSCDASKVALRIHAGKDPDAQTLEASLEEPLPLESGGFHGICCASVLFALSRKGCRTALREFNRLLSADGILILTVPTFERRNSQLFGMHLRGQVRRHGWLRGPACFMRDLVPLFRTLYYGWCLTRLPDHEGFHRFEKEELKQMLLDAGFTSCSFAATYDGTALLVKARRP